MKTPNQLAEEVYCYDLDVPELLRHWGSSKSARTKLVTAIVKRFIQGWVNLRYFDGFVEARLMNMADKIIENELAKFD